MASDTNEQRGEEATFDFDFVVEAEAAGHSVGIRKRDGSVFTWGRTNRLGQLGRGRESGTREKASQPAPAAFEKRGEAQISAVVACAGGMPDSGHTAVVDNRGRLWMVGCDRWQQLGLGSPEGGAGGYTWVGGNTSRSTFVRNDFVTDLLQSLDPSGASVRDVAIGGDHTVVLSSNRRDVVVFGKGGEGQLGLKEKRFLSAPVKSPILSSSTPRVAAVCAHEHCSLALDQTGDVVRQAGKCRPTTDFVRALAACQRRASQRGLIDRHRNAADKNGSVT